MLIGDIWEKLKKLGGKNRAMKWLWQVGLKRILKPFIKMLEAGGQPRKEAGLLRDKKGKDNGQNSYGWASDLLKLILTCLLWYFITLLFCLGFLDPAYILELLSQPVLPFTTPCVYITPCLSVYELLGTLIYIGCSFSTQQKHTTVLPPIYSYHSLAISLWSMLLPFQFPMI